jgi:hypothetical protein
LPTTDCFTCKAVYSETGSPHATAAQIAAPRACPSSNVDCGLTLTNTFSTATCPGRCSAMTSLKLSRIALRRSGSSASGVRITPLVM